MLSYLVIGTCIFLLLAVIYFSVKPISMGIEARRNFKENDTNINDQIDLNEITINQDKKQIYDEIVKLNQLRNEGVITDTEFKKAKQKLLN